MDFRFAADYHAVHRDGEVRMVDVVSGTGQPPDEELAAIPSTTGHEKAG
ncbi:MULTISPECIES: hypothetical protein [unclassified Kitasatospora]